MLSVSSLAVDSTDPNRVYLAGATSSGIPEGVFRTTNGGVGWTNVSGNLPAGVPAYSIVTYCAGSTRVLVVGTDIGVYYSTNEGATWTGFNNGLPRTHVAQLAIDRDQTTIAAFTAGRGAFSTNIAGGATCPYAISPPSANVGAGGGVGNVGVTAGVGCTWAASSNAPWLGVSGGASGSGSGTVTYSVAANSGASARTGTLTIAGLTFTVTQSGAAAGCTITGIDQTSITFAAEGGTWTNTFAVSPSGCTWTATSNDYWISVFPPSGTGNGGVEISVDPSPISGFPRFGSVTIQGVMVRIVQEGG